MLSLLSSPVCVMVQVRSGGSACVCWFWILLNCLSLVFFCPVGGQIQVLGPLEPVVAAPGDDITLKCLVDPKFDIGGKTVEWSKLDLQVNPADPSYVYLYRNRREDVLLMFPSYVGRTKLSTEALKDGNILLLIKNVTLSDNGQYRCFIPDLKSSSRHSTVTLVVDPNYVQMTTTEMPLEPSSLQTVEPITDAERKGQRHHLIPIVVLVILLTLVFGVGLLGYLFLKIKHQTCHPMAQIQA
ncbi:myelin-oligodendrocyte glycoprotein-like [Sphaeramia orbicularis]|uniref:myelin-oligodendrocyte glycoprotein-like n=1 Tax=Sphaeramia orbicularis TaxID=375764 RepID=UPI0011808973|nr:myelin-oligodendrocyte glycoprotein-like [Sphaeramia orbicularis]